jgi:tryptophan halogenase
MKIKNICIVGGGSSGWIAASYLSHNIPQNIKITLIESSDIGTIGVGEGTQPFTMPFLRDCGLSPENWMKSSDATYKYGVEFTGWSKDPVFVDNDTQEMAIMGPGIMYHEYWRAKKGINRKEFARDLPSYKLARNNKAPKMGDSRLDYTPGFSGYTWDAVHFNATALGDTLKEKCINKIIHIDDTIINIPTNDDGVVHLETKNSGNIKADLYIDCSGFNSILLEGALGVNFNRIDDLLLCDSAVAIPKAYTDKRKEMHPYTKSIAMDSGWRWVIPTYSRIGNGYVYSSKHITSEEAEDILRKEIGEFEAEANHIKMKTGIHDYIAYKNVYATGLSAAFAEPLEATGITFSTKAIQNLMDELIRTDGDWNKEVANNLTQEYHMQVQEIVDFIYLHYYFAEKRDTPFWEDVHNVPIPPSAQKIIDMFVPEPPNQLTEKPYFTMFHVGQWFELFYGFGVYDNKPGNASEDIIKYGDWMRDFYNYRTDKLLDIMPNHYEYIKELYDNV